MTKTPSDNLTH